MRSEDVGRFAWRSLRGFRVRSLLTLLAMSIGVSAVVVLTALGDGARRYVVDQFESMGSHLLIVFAGRFETKGGLPPILSETPRDLTIADAMALLRSRSIRSVTPMNIGSASVSYAGKERECPILGTTASFGEIRRVEMASGRFLPAADPDQQASICVLGATVREELFGAEPALGRWVKIGDRRFLVIGVTANTGRALGVDMDQLVVIPIASAQSMFNTFSLFRILVEAKSYEQIEPARRDIESIVTVRHDGENDVTVLTQDALSSAFERILLAMTLGLAGIAAISLAVAGILVMNVMLVSVTERTAEIGLLKALGAPRRRIMTLFLLEASMLSFLGAIAGLALGYFGAWILARIFPSLPTSPPLWAVAAAVLVALATGLLFGWLPARRAAALDPVNALGHHG